MTLEEIAANASRKYRTSQSMVADCLREAILSGVLQEGQSLRQEEIANLFGVSRVPVREALRQLEGEGLVISHAHRGAVVSTLSHDEIREITEMRVALETLATRAAMEHLTKNDLQQAKKALDAIDREKNLTAKGADHDGHSTQASTVHQDGHAFWPRSRRNTGTLIASFACTLI